MTGAVIAVLHARVMVDEMTLRPGMLLKCSHCGRWHEVRLDNRHAGDTPHAREMLYWWCGNARFYAGQIGGRTRYPVKRMRINSRVLDKAT
jgi:hypothetical protein